MFREMTAPLTAYEIEQAELMASDIYYIRSGILRRDPILTEARASGTQRPPRADESQELNQGIKERFVKPRQ